MPRIARTGGCSETECTVHQNRRDGVSHAPHAGAVGDGPDHDRLGRRNGQGRARRGDSRRDRDAHQRNARERRRRRRSPTRRETSCFRSLPVDTYTVEVTMPSFKTLKQSGVAVNPGSRTALGTLDAGSRRRDRDGRGQGRESPLIQSTSGERSFTVPTDSVQNLPFANRGFTYLASLAPGVVGTRHAGAGHAAAACRATS